MEHFCVVYGIPEAVVNKCGVPQSETAHGRNAGRVDLDPACERESQQIF